MHIVSSSSSLRTCLIVSVVVLSSLYGMADEPVKAQPRFENGEAQIVDAFNNPMDWIRHQLWVETEFDSDGDGLRDRMHVDVTRPLQTDTEGLKVPAIYETSPYYCGTGSNDKKYFWDPRHELGETPPRHETPPAIEFEASRDSISKTHVKDWVPRGFAVVHSSSPGTGLSQGCPTVGGDNESLAPKAVIDWLNGRARGFTTATGMDEVKADWCTGKVGMTGTSYNGTLPLAAATTGVEGLEAIIPVAPNTSYYHYYRSNGLVRHPGGYMGEDIDVLYNYINSGDPKRRNFCDCNVRDIELTRGQDRESGDYNEFWAGRDYLNDIGPMKAALLMSHGFNDWNVMPEHSYRIYKAAKEKGLPVQIYYHQGGHGGPPPLSLMNRWFTRYVYGVQNGVEEDPRAWIVREGKNQDEPTPYPDYPNPAAEPVRLHLNPGGRQHGALTLQPSTSGVTEMLIDNFSFDGESLAKAEWTSHRLMYCTPVLSEPVHISGVPSLHIRMSANRAAANLSVWLVALPWNERGKIAENIITRGWADPQNHQAITHSEPLVPGQFYEWAFDLQPEDQIIPAGRQIGLMIFSTDRDFTLWPDPGTEISVQLDSTVLELPVVGGAAAVQTATSPRPVAETSVEASR